MGRSDDGDRNDDSVILNNVAHNNLQDGFFIGSGSTQGKIYNNTSSDNGRYGFNFDSQSISAQTLFRNNHAFNNTTAPSDIATTDAAFLILGDNNNIVGDPLFVDLIDFIPSSSSPLISAGVGGTGDTIGAKCGTVNNLFFIQGG